MPGIEVLVKQLSSEAAGGLVADALTMAASQGLEVAVAVVDEAGQLLAFQRHRRAFPAAIDLAHAKARTAAAFRRDTQALQQGLEQGRTSYLAMPGALPLAGGVVLRAGTEVLGAIGVCGASSSDDARIALAIARRSGIMDPAS